MINFELDEEQQLIRDTVVSFARDEVRPHAREADEKGHVPSDLVQKGWELGLVQSVIPEEFGGFGNAHSAITGAVVAEELAYGDLSIATPGDRAGARIRLGGLEEGGAAALLRRALRGGVRRGHGAAHGFRRDGAGDHSET